MEKIIAEMEKAELAYAARNSTAWGTAGGAGDDDALPEYDEL